MKCEICLNEHDILFDLITVSVGHEDYKACYHCVDKIKNTIRAIGDEARKDAERKESVKKIDKYF